MRDLRRALVRRLLIAFHALGRLVIQLPRARQLDVTAENVPGDAVIVVAHPDDELLGVSGVLAASGSGTVTVHYVMRPVAESRTREAEACAEAFGYNVSWEGKPELHRTDTVYTFAPWDGHSEHRQAHDVAVNACREQGVDSITLFGIFTPITPMLANAYVVACGNKAALFSRLYPSQSHLISAVRALCHWEATWGGCASLELLLTVRVDDVPELASRIPVDDRPRAGLLGSWCALRRMWRLRFLEAR